MAELTTKERLQPSLLDRLTDDEPQKQQESRDRRVLSMRKLRECVLRDLGWLLNTGNLATTEDIDEMPAVASSVVNYGAPDLSGCFSSNLELAVIEKMLRQAIWDFEPRILKKSVKVRAVPPGKDEPGLNALTFVIEGELWAQPVPERLYLKTEIDLETGGAIVREELQSS